MDTTNTNPILLDLPAVDFIESIGSHVNLKSGTGCVPLMPNKDT
ncbi:hypothetical protein [Paenibacillus radicibacter]|nr:hypothetical protein [Paenibacillus radicibacter]